MPVFQARKFRPNSYQHTIAATYRRHLARHPFLLFGLPFITLMVAGSFFLTPATALRYERHDRKMRRLSKEEEMGIGKDRRKVDSMQEEYYRLAAKDLDDWENKRVERMKGEPDGEMAHSRNASGRIGVWHTFPAEKDSWASIVKRHENLPLGMGARSVCTTCRLSHTTTDISPLQYAALPSRNIPLRLSNFRLHANNKKAPADPEPITQHPQSPTRLSSQTSSHIASHRPHPRSPTLWHHRRQTPHHPPHSTRISIRKAVSVLVRPQTNYKNDKDAQKSRHPKNYEQARVGPDAESDGVDGGVEELWETHFW